MKAKSITILITGATSGIGRHTALALARAGHRVFATGRRAKALADLAIEAKETSLETVVLDVTDAVSIAEAERHILIRTDGYGVDAVINNAGYGAMGPVEEISDAALRAQYETNVFGLMAVTRTFLPRMRERGFGRVVNISSIGGLVTSPLMGVYSSTKYAVESLSDALRIELRPFGVKVVLIEPGAIATEFNDVAAASVPSALGSPYSSAIERSNAIFAQFAKMAVGPEHVTRAIFKALFQRSPSARYIAPWRTYAMLWLHRLLPTAWLDAALAWFGGLTTTRTSAVKRVVAIALPLMASAVLLAGSTSFAEDGWKKVSEGKGVTIERRVRPGSQFDELRASAQAPIPPAQFFATVWNYREFPQFVPYLKVLEVLDDDGQTSHVYQRIAMPVVADRDYVLKLTKHVDANRQVYQMMFESAEGIGPSPSEKWVRVHNIRGGWKLEPTADGKGTRITYESFSEPGGNIPTWVANMAQRDAPRDLVLAMTKRAIANHSVK